MEFLAVFLIEITIISIMIAIAIKMNKPINGKKKMKNRLPIIKKKGENK